MERKIRIIHMPNGSVEIDAIGYQGTTCENHTQVFERVFAAGASDILDKKKPEYYQPDVTAALEKAHQRF